MLMRDMLDAALSIQQFLSDKKLEDLKHDDLLRSGIYYKFAVIGEALSQLRHQDETAAQQLSEYAQIIGFRNQIIHGYKHIEDEITWRIVEQKLPVLIKELKQLLNE